MVIRGKNLGPIPGNAGMKADPRWAGNYKSDPLIRSAVRFSTRLFCGIKCPTANAPASASTPTIPQLSNGEIALNDVARVRAMLALATKVGKAADLIDNGWDGVADWLMPEPMVVGGGGDPGDPSVARLAWHAALSRLRVANRRLDAAINAFAEAPHPDDLTPDESHIAGLVAGVHADAVMEYHAAFQELDDASKAELDAQTRYQSLLGRFLDQDDYPEWYQR